MKLYMVRHGESEMNVHSVPGGDRLIVGTSTWSELTETGKRQARELGKHFKDSGVVFDDIHVSSTVRTQQTVRYFMENYSSNDFYKSIAKIKITPELRELSQGDWEGCLDKKTRTEEDWKQIKENPWYFKGPKAESQDDVFQRVRKYIFSYILNDLLLESNVLIVTHEQVIKYFLTGILNLDLKQAYNCTKIKNCEYKIFDYKNGAFQLT